MARRIISPADRLAMRIMLLGGGSIPAVARLFGVAERTASKLRQALNDLDHADADALGRLTLGELGTGDREVFSRLCVAAHQAIDRRQAVVAQLDRAPA